MTIPDIKLQTSRHQEDIQQTSSRSTMEILVSKGCCCIHQLVLHNLPERNVQHYIEMIEELLVSGCEINSQDSQGRTALHVAVNAENHKAVKALLTCGADINVKDISGKTALKEGHDESQALLMRHVEKMVLTRCHVTTPNILIGMRNFYHVNLFLLDKDEEERLDDIEIYQEELARLAEVQLQINPKNLCDLLMTDAYSITRRELRALEKSVKSVDLDVRFPRMACLLRMQYWKAMAIMNLREAAGDSLESLMKKRWPHPCLEILMAYLSERDLKNLFAAKFEDNIMSKKQRQLGVHIGEV